MLEGESGDVLIGSNFSINQYWRELFPEVEQLFKKIKFDEYRTIWLLELEKFLRKFRLIFLKIDNFSDLLIKKIRRVHLNGKLKEKAGLESVEEKTEIVIDDNQAQALLQGATAAKVPSMSAVWQHCGSGGYLRRGNSS